jgi:hypothetical protein
MGKHIPKLSPVFFLGGKFLQFGVSLPWANTFPNYHQCFFLGVNFCNLVKFFHKKKRKEKHTNTQSVILKKNFHQFSK